MFYRTAPNISKAKSFQRRGLKEIPAIFSSVEEEYEAIRHGVGICDLSFVTFLKISGENALSFLQKLTTKDLDFLMEGQTSTCLLLKEDGSFVGEVIVFVMADHYLLLVWPEYKEQVVSHLESHQSASEEVVIEEVDNLHTFLLEGSYSWQLVQDIISFPIEVLPYKNFSPFNYEGRNLNIARLGYTAEYGYIIFGQKEDMDVIWKVIFDLPLAREKDQVRQIGIEALDICRLEVRFPDLTKELGDSHSILESGINWLIDLNKEDFLGKAALLEQFKAGIDRQLVCFVSEEAIEVNEKIVIDGEKIGHIQHVLYSPGKDAYIGVAYVSKLYAASGITYHLESNKVIYSVSSPIVVAKSLSIRIG
ncbi:glycine cleavage T C-terminal barrel domain-containing protein [Geobacillus sp. TFV-3]|uniref:glycine cleavage T C-terminal barrel domain-containing protein n=1 Tax=Geobacillus sp. TFV-3 TaxID=1897059 RepID=UPI001F396B74|nr:glycine cleavage T C-terminal barrel domain-containing protein [Geobacillus sp. TFV-3]KAF0995273.1 Aminomethyltransferase [Geobacillus sp. TFV-3]